MPTLETMQHAVALIRRSPEDYRLIEAELGMRRAAPSSGSIVSLMMFLSIVTSLRALVPFNASEGSFDGRGQRVVIGVQDEDSEQLC
jgi:hypothetical protein